MKRRLKRRYFILYPTINLKKEMDIFRFQVQWLPEVIMRILEKSIRIGVFVFNHRCLLSVKMYLVMGIGWIFELISSLDDNDSFLW